MLHFPPSSPQLWGKTGVQSPPELGDLGGEQTFNDDSQNLCVSGGQDWERDFEPAFALDQINLAAHLLVGDARQQIQTLVEQAFQADVIFLDPFSPPRCPQLWTVEFLSLVAQCLHPQGILATYSCAAAVRAALKLAGLQIGSLVAPGRRWPSTLASHTAQNLPPLSQQEQEHLATRAAVPYRDPSLQDDAAAIQRRRSQEQAQSSLRSTGEWRRRWLA
ncbi:MAG: hypothetical protein F6K00_03440 [Leptolyngbya sp. SIOISBB]|nr:hypothetical protein [Leptolyngbya sp. SIOISBB]